MSTSKLLKMLFQHWSSRKNEHDRFFLFSRDQFDTQIHEIMRKWIVITDERFVIIPHCF